jgi:D-glycero-alpha-D-manno-heptose 1-phosphate guanylyltransferase
LIKEAIILAGGLGTRLREEVPDLPKALAPVAGAPFLSYVLKYFQSNGIDKFIFAVGYKSEIIKEFVKKSLKPDSYEFSVESEPLGTGGAIRMACSKTAQKNVLVLNGDTFFRIDIHLFEEFHQANEADCSLSLKPMHDFDRYGVVRLNENNSIRNFEEKRFYHDGLINGGVYMLNAEKFMQESLPEKFSFEKDWLEKFFRHRKIFGLVQDKYFIDIGIPQDYRRAQTELPQNI